MTDLQTELFKLKDEKYKEFHSKLIPNIDSGKIIGIRMPVLKKFVNDNSDSLLNSGFLNALPHEYYEENNIHIMLINRIKDFSCCIKALDRFLPFIDNWATCDIKRPSCFNKNKEALEAEIDLWLKSSHTYTVRYAIGTLMSVYLKEDFKISQAEKIAAVKSGEYYINMMIAWYFATALAIRWEEIIVFLENRRLPVWVHNKTIQKCVESFRITDEQKAYLKTLKIRLN